MFGPVFPLFFGPEGRPLFGWYHPAGSPSQRSREGLVLCSPLGQEDISAHRTLRHLANAAAQQGTPALRLDYDGCGDSAGDDLDPDRLSAWLASIEAAIDELKRRAGVDRVCLLGIRLGALLASLVAARRDDVGSLIAIAPVVSGRAFVREWTTLGLVREWKSASPGTDAGPAGASASDAPIEAAGFVMSKATRDALSRIDLLQLPSRVAAEVLVIDRDDLPLRDRWATHLARSGAQVTHETLPGYMAMMSEPHNVQVPQAIVSRVLAWLSRHTADTVAGLRAEPVAGPTRVSGAVQETPLLVDDEGRQFGILSEPVSAARPPGERRALILINSGACRHVGPNRMYVPLARQFAARGWSVLRVDVSGLGDSEPHLGQPENAPYTSLAQRDISAWLRLLRERGIAECHLVGICSGAYHGFKAAVAGMPLASVIPVNPAVFFWRDGMPLDPPMAEHRVIQMAEVYKRSMLDGKKWLKLLTGRSDFVRPARVIARRAWARVRNDLRRVVRLVGFPLREDLVVELRKARGYGARMHFIFAAGEAGHRILREQAGSVVESMVRNGQMSMRELAEADHTFSTQAARQALLAELEAHLASSPARATSHEAPVGAPMASA